MSDSWEYDVSGRSGGDDEDEASGVNRRSSPRRRRTRRNNETDMSDLSAFVNTRARTSRRRRNVIGANMGNMGDGNYVYEEDDGLVGAYVKRHVLRDVMDRKHRSVILGTSTNSPFIMFIKDCAGHCGVKDFSSFFEDVGAVEDMARNVRGNDSEARNKRLIAVLKQTSQPSFDVRFAHRMLRPIPMATWNEVDTYLYGATGIDLLSFIRLDERSPLRLALLKLFAAHYAIINLRNKQVSQVSVQLTYCELDAVRQRFKSLVQIYGHHIPRRNARLSSRYLLL